MTPEQAEKLKEEGYAYVMHRPGNRWVGIYPFLFSVAIIGGSLDSIEVGYSDRWCYKSIEQALGALVDWAIADFEGEPVGWVANKSMGATYEHPWEKTD